MCVCVCVSVCVCVCVCVCVQGLFQCNIILILFHQKQDSVKDVD